MRWAREGISNLFSRNPVYVGAFILCALVVSVAVNTELSARKERKAARQQLATAGGNIIIASGGINSRRCDGLHSAVKGVVASGAVESIRRESVGPLGVGLTFDAVTPGFVRLLDPDLPGNSAGAVLLAGPRAAELVSLNALKTSSASVSIGTTTVEWLGDRAFNVFVPTIGQLSTSAECWVSFEPEAQAEGTAILGQLLGIEGQITLQSPPVNDSYEQIEARYTSARSQQLLWGVFVISIVIGTLMSLAQIREAAIYFLNGASVSNVLVVGICHNVLALFFIVVLVVSQALASQWSSNMSPDEILVVAVVANSVLSGGLVGSVVVPVVAGARGWHLALKTD